MRSMEQLKQNYQQYLWECYNNGDLWADKYRPFSFEDWIDAGCPKNIGYEIKKIMREEVGFQPTIISKNKKKYSRKNYKLPEE